MFLSPFFPSTASANPHYRYLYCVYFLEYQQIVLIKLVKSVHFDIFVFLYEMLLPTYDWYVLLSTGKFLNNVFSIIDLWILLMKAFQYSIHGSLTSFHFVLSWYISTLFHQYLYTFRFAPSEFFFPSVSIIQINFTMSPQFHVSILQQLSISFSCSFSFLIWKKSHLLVRRMEVYMVVGFPSYSLAFPLPTDAWLMTNFKRTKTEYLQTQKHTAEV